MPDPTMPNRSPCRTSFTTLTRAVALSLTIASAVGCAHSSSPLQAGSSRTSPISSSTPLRPSAALQRDIANPHLHLLHALDLYQRADDGQREWLTQADVGLATAQRFDPGNFWAQLLRGLLALEQDQPELAVEQFAGAALARPERWEALYGLSLAAHRNGQHELARVAAQAMLQRAPSAGEVLRNSAYALAGAGDGGALQLAAQFRELTGGDDLEGAVQRLLLAATDMPHAAMAEPQISEPAVPQQITLDVAIILNSRRNDSNRGLNLLDGLTTQYGYQRQLTRNRSGESSDRVRTITESISIPQLSYSLNLFNDSGQFYQVLARPSLTAYLGRESEFFAGRQVQVQVSGVNLGTLQPIDIGVGLKVTPEEISARGVRFTVATTRSFLSQGEIGNFSESLTSFRQQVSATAEVDFGQTLLLSSLSEEVTDTTVSKTPGLGDIPLVDTLFNKRSSVQREESLLVLVTPRPSLAFAHPANHPPRAVADLIRLWQQRIDPSSDLATISERVGQIRLLRGVERDRVSLEPLRSQPLLEEARRESLRLAQR